MRKRKRRADVMLQLDSLSDIMTCSAGIVLFMMIQAVLSGSTMVYGRQLPWAREERVRERAHVFLQGGVAIPFDPQPMLKRALARCPLPTSYSGVGSWQRRWNGLKEGDEWINITMYGGYIEFFGSRQLDVGVVVVPRPGASFDNLETIKNPDSGLRRYLGRLDPQKSYVEFIVDPASIGLLEEAAKVARSRGLSINWVPGTVNWPLRESLMGGGDGRRGKSIGGGGFN